MSLSVTLSSALSGLQANARAAEIVSTNVANARTDGYGRREIELAARSLGGTGSGVRVAGILRASDQVLLSDRRIAEADAAAQGISAAYHAKIEATLGTPEDANALGKKIEAFDSALLAAASRPDSEPRLADVFRSARDLATHLSDATRVVQDERARADGRIAASVVHLNDTLAKVAELNGRILKQVAADRDASPLMDQRQQLIDGIAGIVPLREINRDNGQIALVTTGGAVLLDGRPATFGFTPVGTVTADMSIESGALSGITMNGKPISFRDGTGKLDGGTLAADMKLRDRDAPRTQGQLDGLARELIGRFADPAVDGTLAAGAPGLFTDAGGAFDIATEIGLAGRLTANAAADPDKGGALWRLRDGLGAPVPGAPGAAALLTRLRGALTARTEPASGGFTAGLRSFAALSSDALSQASAARVGAESAQSFATAKYGLLRGDELSQGVDSDREVQDLLQIEQAYAANAKVIKAVDDMIQTLLGI